MLNVSKCCIIGIPDHQAVIHVGGRLGAARGPSAFRKIFARMKSKDVVQDVIEDLGDVRGLGIDISENHRLASNAIRDGHSHLGASVVIGGSHDHGYSHLLGVFNAIQGKKRIACINIDAHLDVRKPTPQITSGSPFYLAIESKILKPSRFVEFGIQSHCNGPDLWKYVEDKKINVIGFEQLRNGKALSVFKKTVNRLLDDCDQMVISLDLDAAASAFAPGVSAPQAEGFSSSEVIQMIEWAATQKKIKSLGIFELNPEHDLDDRTARLAATVAFHFIEHKFF